MTHEGRAREGRGAGRCGGHATGRGAGLGLRGPGGARSPRHAAAAAVFLQLALRCGRYWAAQWHLARAVGKRFRGCRAKRFYVNYRSLSHLPFAASCELAGEAGPSSPPPTSPAFINTTAAPGLCTKCSRMHMNGAKCFLGTRSAARGTQHSTAGAGAADGREKRVDYLGATSPAEEGRMRRPPRE